MRKVVTLRDVIAKVRDGAHVAFGGFAITRCVVAAACELVRARTRGLELTQVIGGMDTDIAVGGGCVRKLRYSGGSLDRFGPLECVNRAIVAGELEFEEYSSLALTLRLHAAALGLPFIAATTMLGSDLLGDVANHRDAFRVEDDPFTGAPVLALAPLRPDIAFVHVDACDEALAMRRSAARRGAHGKPPLRPGGRCNRQGTRLSRVDRPRRRRYCSSLRGRSVLRFPRRCPNGRLPGATTTTGTGSRSTRGHHARAAWRTTRTSTRMFERPRERLDAARDDGCRGFALHSVGRSRRGRPWASADRCRAREEDAGPHRNAAPGVGRC